MSKQISKKKIRKHGQAYKAMLAQLRWFAGTPIRNVAAIGGNVANASPISDLNPVLMACKV